MHILMYHVHIDIPCIHWCTMYTVMNRAYTDVKWTYWYTVYTVHWCTMYTLMYHAHFDLSSTHWSIIYKIVHIYVWLMYFVIQLQVFFVCRYSHFKRQVIQKSTVCHCHWFIDCCHVFHGDDHDPGDAIVNHSSCSRFGSFHTTVGNKIKCNSSTKQVWNDEVEEEHPMFLRFNPYRILLLGLD